MPDEIRPTWPFGRARRGIDSLSQEWGRSSYGYQGNLVTFARRIDVATKEEPCDMGGSPRRNSERYIFSRTHNRRDVSENVGQIRRTFWMNSHSFTVSASGPQIIGFGIRGRYVINYGRRSFYFAAPPIGANISPVVALRACGVYNITGFTPAFCGIFGPPPRILKSRAISARC